MAALHHTHLFESVHLGVEVGNVEHADGGLKAEVVDAVDHVPEAAAHQQHLHRLEQVRETAHLLLLGSKDTQGGGGAGVNSHHEASACRIQGVQT